MPRQKSPKWIPYFERLKDPRWQKLRLKVMERDEWRCRECDRHDKTLNVHHPIYIKGRQPWEYEMHMLVTLCEDCHEKREEAIFNLSLLLINFTTADFYVWAKKIRAEHERFDQVKERIESAAPPLPPLPPVVYKNTDPTVWEKMKEPEERILSHAEGKTYFDMMREAIG